MDTAPAPPSIKTPSPITSTSPVQPVYVMPIAGDTPVYLDKDNTRLLSTSSKHSNGPGDMQYEPTEMYEDVNVASPTEMYEDVNVAPTEMYEELIGSPTGGETSTEMYEELTAVSPSEIQESSMYDSIKFSSNIEEVYDNPSNKAPPTNRFVSHSVHASSVPSMPLPPLPRSSTNPSSTSAVYMPLNPSSIEERQLYASPNSGSPVEDEAYVSVEPYMKVINEDRMQSEEDYV